MTAVRAWFHFAPHLVRPLRVVIPAYGHGTRGPAALAGAICAFHSIAFDRNRGISRDIRLPRSGILSRRQFCEAFPDLRKHDVTGGAFWYDGQMLDATRLTLECLWDAVGAGAVAANHVECVGLLHGAAGVVGVAARDTLTGRDLEIRARLTVNATGPWVDRILRASSGSRYRGPTTAWTRNANLVTRRFMYPGQAIGVTSSRPSDASIGNSKRLFFASPWRECTVIGTAHETYDGDPDALDASDGFVEEFLQEVNGAIPGLRLDRNDILSVHLGLTPAENSATERAKRPVILDHESESGTAGLISVAGIKFTTAPIVATRTVKLALRKLHRAVPAKLFDLPGTGAPDSDNRQSTLSDLGSGREHPEIEWIRHVYGTRAIECLDSSPHRAEDMAEHAFRCRVRHGIKHEMVVRLSDAVLRATDWAERGMLTNSQLDWCERSLAEAHGWSDDRTRQERARTYRALKRQGISLCGS